MRISDQLYRQKALDFLAEDASKTVYRSDDETLAQRLLDLGIVISHILASRGEHEGFELVANGLQGKLEKPAADSPSGAIQTGRYSSLDSRTVLPGVETTRGMMMKAMIIPVRSRHARQGFRGLV